MLDLSLESWKLSKMSDGEDDNTKIPKKQQPAEDGEEDEKDDETRAAEDKAAREAAKKRCYKFSDPPKVYTDVNVSIMTFFVGHDIDR